MRSSLLLLAVLFAVSLANSQNDRSVKAGNKRAVQSDVVKKIVKAPVHHDVKEKVQEKPVKVAKTAQTVSKVHNDAPFNFSDFIQKWRKASKTEKKELIKQYRKHIEATRKARKAADHVKKVVKRDTSSSGKVAEAAKKTEVYNDAQFNINEFFQKWRKASKDQRKELMKQYKEHIEALEKTDGKAKSVKKIAKRDALFRLISKDFASGRPKRDIAATVVGAAVSTVVANLLKNVQNAHETHEEVAPQKQADEVPVGAILGQGDFPIANEVVPLPFAPVKADLPGADKIAPAAPNAPIQADVEVIVGASSTSAPSTSTAATPAPAKKGFWATFFGSIKLFFGTVTNSVGGFFIDVGQRVSDFAERRIKV